MRDYTYIEGYRFTIWNIYRSKRFDIDRLDINFADKDMSEFVRGLRIVDHLENERYLQGQSMKNRYVDEETIAKKLGIKRDLLPFVPSYVCQMDYEISPERTAQGVYLYERFKELEKEIKGSDLKEWDLQKTVVLYTELFDRFEQWNDEPLYCNANREIHEKWTKDPHSFWKRLESLSCSLYFEANFMRLKPQIRVIYENAFWKSAMNAHLAQGFGGHFQKTQDFAFKQLQRLYVYRDLKQKSEKNGA